MTIALALNDILIWSVQIGFLVAVAAAVPPLLRLKLPNAKLAYWQVVLVACLLLPVMRAWKQEVIGGTVIVSTAIVSVAPIPAAARSASLPHRADLFLGFDCGGNRDPAWTAYDRILAASPSPAPIAAAGARFTLGRRGGSACFG